MTKEEYLDLDVRKKKLEEKFDALTKQDPDQTQVIQEALKCFVPVSEDPISEGLNTLLKKLSQVQKAKDYLTTLVLKTLHQKVQWDLLAKEGEKLYKDKVEKLIREKDEVGKQSSDAKRIGAANAYCGDELYLNALIEEKRVAAEDCYKVCARVAENLESTSDTLKDQITVVQQLISIGEIGKKITPKGGD